MVEMTVIKNIYIQKVSVNDKLMTYFVLGFTDIAR